MISACRTRRGDIPASVRSLLTVPFVPDDLVALVRPHDLTVVKVRRQHVLDCSMGTRKKNSLDLYKGPHGSPALNGDHTSVLDQPEIHHHPGDDLLSISCGSYVDDIGETRQQNRAFGKRSRTLESVCRTGGHLLEDAVNSGGNSSDDDCEPVRAAFRPSATQQRVSRTILHTKLQGKSCPYILERMQQSVNNLAVPPVCRGLLDYGFGAHGLTLMHCRPVDLWDPMQVQDSNVSFTDFPERNTLRLVAPSSSRSDITSALRSLRVFARHFYNQAILGLIDGASSFIDSHKGVSDTDAVSWKLLVF